MPQKNIKNRIDNIEFVEWKIQEKDCWAFKNKVWEGKEKKIIFAHFFFESLFYNLYGNALAQQ